MPFGDQLAGGLGFMSNFPTPAAGGLAVAAGVIGALAGPGESLAMNPYAEHWQLFEVGGCLWGAPLTDRDYPGGKQAGIPLVQESTGGFTYGSVDEKKGPVMRWLFYQRKTWSLPAEGTRCGYRTPGTAFSGIVELAPGEVLLPKRGSVMRISVLNALLAEYRQRQEAMAASTVPTFHYIDRRTWSEAEIEYWQRSAPAISLPQWRSLKGPRPVVAAMTYAQRHIYDLSLHAKTRDYYADAKAEHEQLLVDNAAWYRDEAARWTEWKKDLAREAAVQEQGARLEQAIHDYVQNAEDPDRALQAVANGDVQFALDDRAPSAWISGASTGAIRGSPGAAVLGGASGSWVGQADEKPSGALVLLGAAAVVALLIGAAE